MANGKVHFKIEGMTCDGCAHGPGSLRPGILWGEEVGALGSLSRPNSQSNGLLAAATPVGRCRASFIESNPPAEAGFRTVGRNGADQVLVQP